MQEKPKLIYADCGNYLNRPGSSLNTAGIDYPSLRAADALKRPEQSEEMTRAGEAYR